MALFMDIHRLADSVTPDELTQCHLNDLKVQGNHGVQYLTYWFNDATRRAFCLCEAPSAEAAVSVHRDGTSGPPDDIIEVDARTVEAFLGKVEETAVAQDHSRLPTDTAFRTILFTDLESSVAMTQKLGDAGMMDLLRAHDAIIRAALVAHAGIEVKHTGDGIMACFTSVSAAIDCAIAVQKGFASYNQMHPERALGVRVGLSAGEPVEEHQDLYGAAVQMAARVCQMAEPGEILVQNVVRELSLGKTIPFVDRGETHLKGFDQPVRLHEVRWRE
jgi:class 3 adenylate cyclase